MVGLDVGTGDDLFAAGNGGGLWLPKGVAEVVFAGFAAAADEQNGVADETLVIFFGGGGAILFFPWAFGGKNPNAQVS